MKKSVSKGLALCIMISLAVIPATSYMTDQGLCNVCIRVVNESGMPVEDAMVHLYDTTLEREYYLGTTNLYGIACISGIPCTNYSVHAVFVAQRGKLKLGGGTIDALTQTAITVKIRTFEFSEFVTIQPLDEHGRILQGARIALECTDAAGAVYGYGAKITGTDGTVTYEGVPYGSCIISVIARDYELAEPAFSKKYTVDEEVEFFQPKMKSTLPTSTPTAIPGFEPVLAIANLLTVAIYLLRRRK